MAASAVQNNNFWVLLKNYDSIFYWKRIKGEHIYETLKRNATIIPIKEKVKVKPFVLIMTTWVFIR